MWERHVRVDAVVNKPRAELLVVISHVFSLVSLEEFKEFKILGCFEEFCLFFFLPPPRLLPFAGDVLTLVSWLSLGDIQFGKGHFYKPSVMRSCKALSAFPLVSRMCLA